MIKKIEPYKGISNTYDEIRPSYPEKLIQDIIFKTQIKLDNRLLEIGAGTGKATIQFAAPFEEWNSPNEEKFDMIYCAQAFHWIDTSIKYKKCHELLKDEGYLVLFWYNASDSESYETRLINQKTEEIIKKYVDRYFVDKGQPKRSAHSGISNEDEREAEIMASGLFEIIEKIEYTQEKRNNAEQCLKARKSVPAFASILDGLGDEAIEKMDNEIREIINNYGGYTGTTFSFSLYITKRIRC